MILLHKDGSIVELGAVESIRPISRNSQTRELIVEICFASGRRANYSDVWYAKNSRERASIYDLELGEKFPVDWREIIRRVV